MPSIEIIILLHKNNTLLVEKDFIRPRTTEKLLGASK